MSDPRRARSCSTSVLAALLSVVVAAWGAADALAEPSAAAQRRAVTWAARVCPALEPASMGPLAAIFQRTIDQRRHNGRIQIQPIQRFAAAAEIATLAEYCRRPGVRVVRVLPSVTGVRSPDFVVEQDGVPSPRCVEVVAVTGRYPRAWQYRASKRGKRTLHIGARAPTDEHIARAIDRKIGSGQLTSSFCPDGGVIALHVAGRRANRWPKIARAVRDRRLALQGAAHVKALEVRSRGTRIDVERDARGRVAVVAAPDLHLRYQTALRSMRRRLPVIDRGGARGAPFGAAGLDPLPGAVVRAVSRQSTGGIDFSSLELRYVSDNRSRRGRGVRYAFRARPGAGPGDPALGLRLAQDASDAFFVWLALPPKSFWVNLNPTQPDRIIDPVFGRSDAGRVLLEADLALKKVVAPLVHPGTASGRQFWAELEGLYGARPDLACFSVRQWIVPEPATIHESADELFILDAPLTVKIESEFIGGFPGGGCPQRDEAFETAKEEIYRRLILPGVIQAVNGAPEFAALRRAYLSRIAAEWYRRRHADRRSAFGAIANSGDIGRWVARPAWDPLEVFNRYVQSVRNGEWTTNRTVRVGGRARVLTLVFGGVDFSRTPSVAVRRRDFRRRWPGLAARVRTSLRRPATDAAGGEVWLGGRSR